MKTCTTCKKEKNDIDFSLKKKGTLFAKCKLCLKSIKQKYYKKYQNIFLEKSKAYYKNNKEKIKAYSKQYIVDNKEAIQKVKKQHYINNIKEYKKYNKQYRAENKKKRNEHEKHRKLIDPNYKLRKNISIFINGSIKKNYLSIKKYLPYTIEELKDHLEQQFESWMTWSNWGRYDTNTWKDDDQSTWTWQIDHIIPHSTFNYTSMEDEEFKKCWSLNNLRPLSAKQNHMDGVKRTRHI